MTKITELNGEVRIQTSNGEVRTAKYGEIVHNGETLITGKNTSVEISDENGTITKLSNHASHTVGDNDNSGGNSVVVGVTG